MNTRTPLYASVAVALFLSAGCLTVEEPEPNNGDSNAVNANLATSCTDNSGCGADQECLNDRCQDLLSCTSSLEQGCPDGTLLADVNGEEGCFAECDAGVCPGDQTCDFGLCVGTDAAFDEGCVIDWTSCDDAKEYRVSCTEGTCACIVNGADTGSFDTQTSCDESAFFREVNAGCGWRVPSTG